MKLIRSWQYSDVIALWDKSAISFGVMSNNWCSLLYAFSFCAVIWALYMHKRLFSLVCWMKKRWFFLRSQIFDIRAGQSHKCLMMIINGWLLRTLISICLTFQFMLSKKELSLAWPVVFPPHGPEKQTQMTTNTDMYIHCHQHNSTHTFLTPGVTENWQSPVNTVCPSPVDFRNRNQLKHLTPSHVFGI